MKNRILAILLTLALLLSMCVVPTFAYGAGENTTKLEGNCVCGCGKDMGSITWTPWNVNAEGDPASGHYYLESDYVQKDQISIISGNRVVLDLRGHTVTTDDNHRFALVYGYIAIMDSVGGGRLSAKTTGSGFGGIMMVSTNETNDATVELYSGTLMPDAASKGSRRGGIIHLGENSTFRMFGGRLMNGTTYSASEPDKKEAGGAVAGNSSSSLIEIRGGEIIGCSSASSGGSIYNIGTTILENCKIIGGEAAANGGNITQNGGTLTITNCVIADGVSHDTSYGGGNIALMSSSVLTVKDSVIRNGYTSYYGGNLYFGSSSGTIENTTIFAGVAEKRGANLYGSSSATGLTLKNVDITGDVGYAGKNLVLEGKVKIGLLSNGLRLWYGDTAVKADASGLTEGSEIYVDAKGTFTDAGANLAYFKGALRAVLSESADGLVATQAASGELGGYCPHCQQRVTWYAFDTTASLVQNCLLDSSTDTDPACTGRHLENGHYYLTKSYTAFSQHYVGIFLSVPKEAKDVVIDLNGYNITGGARAFYIRPSDSAAGVGKSTLTLLASIGNSVVTGGGTANQGGGVIYNEGSNLNIYGGKYVYKSAGKNVACGGVVYNGGTLSIHGGTLDGSDYSFTDASTSEKTYTYNGGAVFTSNGTKNITISAGRFVGGTVQSGGALYFGYNNQIEITGGQFVGGDAQKDNGGAIRLYSSGTSYKSGKLEMSNAAVTGGTAKTAGGCLFTQYYTVNISDSYFDGGHANDYAGLLSCGSAVTMNVEDTILVNGTANRGANLYSGATSAVGNFKNVLILNGSATTYGGNVNCGNGEFTFKGGEIAFGSATTYGGNFSVGTGNHTASNFTKFMADENGNVPMIVSGTAKTNGGNIYISGHCNLQAAYVGNGNAGGSGDDIYFSKASTRGNLTVGEALAGDISIFVAASLLGTNVYGEAISRTICEKTNANLVLEGSYGSPVLCAKNGNLYVGAATVVTQDGNETWYADAASAVAAVAQDEYVKLYIGTDLVLDKDCAVDINGKDVTVSGSGSFFGMDSVGGGNVQLQEGKEPAFTYLAPDGMRYVSVRENGITNYHQLDMRITGVALRPSADGIYYTAVWNCDDVLAGMIESHGVAVSLYEIPDNNCLSAGSGSLYTTFTDLNSGEQKTSAMVGGIMKTAEEGRTAELNNTYGNMNIHAKAYVKFTNGQVLVSDDSVNYSLYEVMNAIDGLITSDPINYRPYTNTVRAFYDKWDEFGMGDWEFNKVDIPEDDGVIDILMIGGSFSYYYVEELYGMAEAAGIPMRVCNLYYSGAGPQEHWNWWKKGQSPCQFYNTDGNGRVCTDNVGLEWALAQGEWDVLSLQYPSGTVRTATPQEGFASLDSYASELAAYLKEQFPDALFCWQQVWGYQVGYDRNGFAVPTREVQLGLYQRHKEIAYMAADAYGAQIIPSGEAWEYVRSTYGYDNLCARLGKGTNHEGDYYHEGDIGGGQYLNACVWFEMLTGESCVGNTYVPSYVYNKTQYGINSDIQIEQLQQAAHWAVEQLKAGQ